MSQSPHASASTSVVGKATDVITNSYDFFIIGLEDDCIFTSIEKNAYEKLLNEEAYIRNLFEKRSLCISEYEIAKDAYNELLRNNRAHNSRAYLLDDAARKLDEKRNNLYEIDTKLNNDVTAQSSEKKEDSAKSVSKIATAGNNLKEIIVARKDGGTRKTLVRSSLMANHFRTYPLRTSADLGRGQKSFIKNNKIDWDEFKSQYKASNISRKLKSEMPWVGDWIKSCNKDVVMLKFAAACNTEIDAGISAQLNFSAEAQFLRAATSLSWTYEYDLKKGRLSTKIDGGVYATLAEAKSTASFMAPRNGITLRLADIYLGVIRASITVAGSAGVGAAITGSLFIDVDASGKTISKLPSTIRSIRSTEPGSVADLSGLPGGKAGVSGSAFAGVSADASIAGALEWKSPEVVNGKENEFKALASIKPGLSATAGIGGELEYYFDFTDGVFRIFCKAALCIGIGGKGNIGFEVDTNQIGNFMVCAYHQVCSSKLIASARASLALAALSLGYLESGIEAVYDMTIEWYNDIITDWGIESKRIEIMQNINENPDILKYTVPAAKGILIYLLMNSAWWAGVRPSNNVDSLRDLRVGSNPRKRAIISIFTWVQSKEEFREVMRHIKESIDSPSIYWKEGFNKVSDFLGKWEWLPAFTAPYVGSDYEGNLQRFYERLHEKHPVGYPVIRNNMEEYLARTELAPGYIYPLLDDRSDFRQQMLAQARAHHDENIV